jgi:hypothetical protein
MGRPNCAARGFACLREKKKQVHKTDFKVLESYYMFGCRTFGETMLQLEVEKYECEMLEYEVEREIVQYWISTCVEEPTRV